ncbi:uncharacterized protein LOC134533264 [Bacillus rossius redtenbacheri]|uniref:uncharacterized protein LOC134533264 n=1 Tax=Bacillus rossius redtenbacheri TaxID=93214 RepID=UPI002FDE9DAC
MASKLRKTTFRDEWNQNPSLSWAQAIDGSPYAAWCKLCNHRIELSNMGKQALTSHASGVKHSRRVQGFHMSSSIAVYCKTTRPTSAASQNNSASESSSPLSESSKLFSSDEPSSPQVSSPPLFQTDPVSSSKSLPDTSSNADNSYLNPSATCSCTCTCGSARKESKSLTNYLLNDSVTRAEILWCLYCVMAHNSLRNAENSVAMHRKMYHDSKIAAKLQLGKSKVSYTIVHGLAPEFQKELHADISKSSHLVVGFDESLNKIAQKQQMDISVRYWNEDDSITCTRYLTSAFLGHSTAADLLSAFKNSLPVNTLHKIIQVSMDGPNVNLRFLKDLKQDLKEGRTDEGVILDIGTCGLHSLHCAFKGAMKETGWEIVKFLRAIYNLFHNIPTRRADYIRITGSSLFPLKFCPVRWLDNVPVADRALKILPNLRNYVAGLKSNTEPTCASFVIVKSAIKDVLLGPKLAFFSSVAAEVEPLLKEYQTNDPMAPYLFSDFSSVIKNFMTRFVKADVMANTTLSKIDLSANNLVSSKKIDLGFGTRAALRSENASQKDMELFRADCLKCLQECVKRILKRSPLTFSLTRGISFADPSVALIPDLAIKRLSCALDIFVSHNWLSGIQGDKISKEFKRLCSLTAVQEHLKLHVRSKVRLDKFWFDLLNVYCSENTGHLASFLKMIFIMSHGNAAVERGFSINKQCLVENQLDISLIAQRTIHDGILSAGGLDNFVVSKRFIHAARNAYLK